MRTAYDSRADAMYLSLTEKAVASTVRVSSRVAVDLHDEGNLRGIEVLFVSRALADTDFTHVHLELPRIVVIDLRLPVAAA